MFLLYISAKLCAQPPPSFYNETFGIAGLQNGLTCIKKFDSSYLALSLNVIPGYPAKSCVYKFNSVFDRVDSVILELNNQSILNFVGSNLIQDSVNNSYYVSGRIYQDFNNSSRADGNLWKLDANLDIIWHKTYLNTNDSSIIITGSILVDTCVILYGQTKETDTNGDAFVIKTDLNGNELMRRKYPVANRFGGISKMIHTIDNCYLSIENIMDFPSWGYSDIKVTKYDSLFNPIWSQIYGSPYLDYLGDLIELSDGNFVFSQGLGITQALAPWGTLYTRGTLTKISKNNGGVIWQQSYGATRAEIQLYGVLERNNKIFALGYTATSCAPEVKPNCTHISYMLVANQNGDSLHYVEIFSDSLSRNNYLYDLAPTSDGFFCVGSASVYNGAWDQQNWVVKADTNGCFNFDCAQGIGLNEIRNNKAPDVILFPNPATNILTIQLPFLLNPFDFNKDISLYDASGKIVLKQKVNNQKFNIDISEFENGIYFITIADHELVFVSKKFIKN